VPPAAARIPLWRHVAWLTDRTHDTARGPGGPCSVAARSVSGTVEDGPLPHTVEVEPPDRQKSSQVRPGIDRAAHRGVRLRSLGCGDVRFSRYLNEDLG
jgi:hypothetical protein